MALTDIFESLVDELLSGWSKKNLAPQFLLALAASILAYPMVHYIADNFVILALIILVDAITLALTHNLLRKEFGDIYSNLLVSYEDISSFLFGVLRDKRTLSSDLAKNRIKKRKVAACFLALTFGLIALYSIYLTLIYALNATTIIFSGTGFLQTLSRGGSSLVVFLVVLAYLSSFLVGTPFAESEKVETQKQDDLPSLGKRVVGYYFKGAPRRSGKLGGYLNLIPLAWVSLPTTNNLLPLGSLFDLFIAYNFKEVLKNLNDSKTIRPISQGNYDRLTQVKDDGSGLTDISRLAPSDILEQAFGANNTSDSKNKVAACKFTLLDNRGVVTVSAFHGEVTPWRSRQGSHVIPRGVEKKQVAEKVVVYLVLVLGDEDAVAEFKFRLMSQLRKMSAKLVENE